MLKITKWTESLCIWIESEHQNRYPALYVLMFSCSLRMNYFFYEVEKASFKVYKAFIHLRYFPQNYSRKRSRNKQDGYFSCKEYLRRPILLISFLSCQSRYERNIWCASFVPLFVFVQMPSSSHLGSGPEKKIGHRRVDATGETTYKKVRVRFTSWVSSSKMYYQVRFSHIFQYTDFIFFYKCLLLRTLQSIFISVSHTFGPLYTYTHI